jgi:hypothetical protein
MAAPNITAILHEYEGQITHEILRDTLNQSPYLDLPKEESLKEGWGKLQQVLTYDRSLPANPVEWADITTSDGEAGGACVPPAQSLQITKTLREFNMQHTALHSPYFCYEDLVDATQAEDQMEQIFGILKENTAQLLIDRNRSEYTRLAEHKVICSLEGGLLDDDEWLAQEPTSILTPGMLKKTYARLVRQGAGRVSYGAMDGRPTFLGIGGMEITERLFTDAEHRKDIRESNRVPELLAPLGAERYVKGFWLMDDVFPPRWNLEGGEWVEVKPYIWSGGKLIDNPAYETATAEDFVIFTPEVYRLIVPPAPKNKGKAEFKGISYRGEWRCQNIEDEDKNPDGNICRFRGVFKNGSKPLWPKYGHVLRFLRCDLPLEATACDES